MFAQCSRFESPMDCSKHEVMPRELLCQNDDEKNSWEPWHLVLLRYSWSLKMQKSIHVRMFQLKGWSSQRTYFPIALPQKHRPVQVWQLQLSDIKTKGGNWQSCDVERILADQFLYSRSIILWTNAWPLQRLPLHHPYLERYGQAILHYSSWLRQQWAKG